MKYIGTVFATTLPTHQVSKTSSSDENKTPIG